MILGPLSWLDCLAFLVFLAPQLILRVGFWPTLICGLQALPFLLIKLPLSIAYQRLCLRRTRRTPFVQNASLFEDVVVRCVRYAFAYIPPRIGRVFFSKAVSLPFLRLRMLRHGYLHSPIHWQEVNQSNFKGIWIIDDQYAKPDIVIYYVHGGGFSMGSSYFYLEFLLAWLSLLKASGSFRNPAIFALEYTLVPDSSYPVQLHEAVAGYKHVVSITQDPSRICVSGDSAGATLILSLLLHLAQPPEEDPIWSSETSDRVRKGRLNSKIGASLTPGMAVLISPWATLRSPLHRNTTSDYLDIDSLHSYASQYAGSKISIDDPLISPGSCRSLSSWRRASPTQGFYVTFGAEEVFAPEINRLVRLWQEGQVSVKSVEVKSGIHAWPIAAMYASSAREERLKGLQAIIQELCQKMV